MNMSIPEYEVFAIRVGANAQRTARENFLYDACCGDPNASMPLDYYFWVIRNAQQVIVVDTCFQPATADRRNRQMYRLPEQSLRQLDIDPTAVKHLILTHLHWDHAGNLGLFPNATVHLQEAELRFCTGPKMTHRTVNKTYEVEDVMSALPPLFEGRMRLHGGGVEVMPGVTLHPVAGIRRAARWYGSTRRVAGLSWRRTLRTCGPTSASAARFRFWMIWRRRWRRSA
jgi:glyoxylase-like metal-dependent hydrolase (beta-lactamase superfamily II)